MKGGGTQQTRAAEKQRGCSQPTSANSQGPLDSGYYESMGLATAELRHRAPRWASTAMTWVGMSFGTGCCHQGCGSL
ncbi:rCG45688 [Rattus norvegicus]|uniref:RCG45688 n=1 Tax=Rattus norvegicus TaxID=10116 RepID=A6JU35_RAT|nr:rCG45688 [Rattus norvegicus]